MCIACQHNRDTIINLSNDLIEAEKTIANYESMVQALSGALAAVTAKADKIALESAARLLH